LAQTASGTTNDMQHKSFVDSPSRGSDYAAREVFVGNTNTDPVPVTFAVKGTIKQEYNEITSSTLVSTTIINKTIGVGLGSDIISIECSGENRAVFSVEINSTIVAKNRIYFTEFNTKFNLSNLSLVAGDNIKIIVENKTVMTATFNATLTYSEYSV